MPIDISVNAVTPLHSAALLAEPGGPGEKKTQLGLMEEMKWGPTLGDFDNMSIKRYDSFVLFPSKGANM